MFQVLCLIRTDAMMFTEGHKFAKGHAQVRQASRHASFAYRGSQVPRGHGTHPSLTSRDPSPPHPPLPPPPPPPPLLSWLILWRVTMAASMTMVAVGPWPTPARGLSIASTATRAPLLGLVRGAVASASTPSKQKASLPFCRIGGGGGGGDGSCLLPAAEPSPPPPPP